MDTDGVHLSKSYLGAGFEVPEGATFKHDPVPLTHNEGHHDDNHHQQEERRQNGHDPQVAGWCLHHSCKQTNISYQYLSMRSITSEQLSYLVNCQ